MKYTQEELNSILEKHVLWINNKEGGIRADFQGADLYIANFRGANLYKANFTGANLTGANFIGANLTGANLTGADLYIANLTGAYLYIANFRGANLYKANFTGANLTGANLTGANLYKATLIGANLTGADFRGANLEEAKIEKKYLTKLINERNICPKTDSFIAYKKVRINVILKLEVLGDRVGGVISRKCRTNKVKVLEAYDINGNKLKNIRTFKSNYTSNFIYTLNEIIEEPNYNNNPLIDCSEGIHFFLTFEEAKNYKF